jgi:DNA-binding transcriptional ArsR family regulator
MSSDRLSATFAALADPTRRAILARLASGETTVSELARPFEMSLPAVTKHLKVLQRAGLISQGRQAQWRPCKLEAQPLQDVSNWVEQYRQFWELRLDRLEEYLRELQAAEQLASQTGEVKGGTQDADKAAVVPKARGKK